MKKFFTIILFVCASGITLPQSERIMSMGGLKYIMPDKEITLNPFDFGGNPAWLMADDRNSWLKIIPSFSQNSGDYKRRYDPTTQDLYSVEFIGIKNLGEDGTFLGETSYMYNYRGSVPRSLRYDTYDGDAFFFVDTTTGNFRYNGPQVNFMYSFQLVNNLFTGASVRYRILDGLKNIYSRAESLIRQLEGNVGAVYAFNDNLVAGLNYIYTNDQEKIEAKSEDLLDVEVFHYRGDTYAIKKRTQTGEMKSTDKAHNLSGQIYYRDVYSEAALKASFGRAAQKILMPYTVGEQSFKEFEEGYTSFNTSSVEFRSRFMIAENLYVGTEAGYFRDYVWSKNSAKNLLLWEWTFDQINGGAGISWMPSSSLSLGLEYVYSKQNADSSKYIDNSYPNLTSGNHNLRLGAEYEVMKDVRVRAGYNFSLLGKDLIYGGENVSIHRLTAGFGIILANAVELNIHLAYGFYEGLPGSLERTDYMAFSSIKLYSF